MTERKSNAGSRGGKNGRKGQKVPEGQAAERAQRLPPELDQEDRDSRRGAPHADAPQPTGGARDVTSMGGQQQGGPGAPPFPRLDRANDGGSPKNRR